MVALIVFGPRRLPELGSSLGQAIREFRRATNELTREVREGVDEARPAAAPPPAGAQTQAPAATAPLICQSCGTANAEHTKFCGQCGKQLGTA